MSKTVLITGASSGFGKLTAQKFQAEGWNVAATMRSPDKGADLAALENTAVIALDVTAPASIDAALAETKARFGGLDALINNAGHGGHGLFEQFTDADIRAMFDTNFFGALNVARAVLPGFRAQGGGAIINVTSLSGFISGPTSGIYAATKHALEAVTESMAMEYGPLGIKVRSVAPGAFVTGFTSAYRDGTAPIGPDLQPHADQMRAAMGKIIDDMYAKAGPASEVSDQIFACVTGDTPIRCVVGADAIAIANALSSMPRQDVLDQLMSGR